MLLEQHRDSFRISCEHLGRSENQMTTLIIQFFTIEDISYTYMAYSVVCQWSRWRLPPLIDPRFGSCSGHSTLQFPSRSANGCQPCLGSLKYRHVYRLATTAHCVRKMSVQACGRFVTGIPGISR